jgi:hypothetical protein
MGFLHEEAESRAWLIGKICRFSVEWIQWLPVSFERLRAVRVFAVMSLCNFACIGYYLKKKQRMAVVIADAA